MRFKSTIRKLYWLLSSQFGLDLRLLSRAIYGVPAYLRDLITFRRVYQGKIMIMPCLHDRYEEGGAIKNEYFWQDLLVARAIHDKNPIKHVDVGSRVDGFIAHVASFRECEVFDVRPIRAMVPGLVFKEADLMDSSSLPIVPGGYCDSLSCLHAIEHFGLGRYGDPINPIGYQRGIANMAKLLQPGGTFYLSTPIGQERVEFNANWVFAPSSIVNCAKAVNMTLRKLIIITSANGPEEKSIDAATLEELSLEGYQLGLFIFTKNDYA